MKNVQYTLDDEGGIDPTDPLGNLTITGEDGSSLFLMETFVDVWLLSLLRGLLSIGEHETLTVEVLEEPNTILMTSDSGIINLVYKGESTFLKLEQAVSSLIEAARRFVYELSEYDGVESNTVVKELEELILRGRGNRGTHHG